jgi:hypothetical protein
MGVSVVREECSVGVLLRRLFSYEWMHVTTTPRLAELVCIICRIILLKFGLIALRFQRTVGRWGKAFTPRPSLLPHYIYYVTDAFRHLLSYLYHPARLICLNAIHIP